MSAIKTDRFSFFQAQNVSRSFRGGIYEKRGKSQYKKLKTGTFW